MLTRAREALFDALGILSPVNCAGCGSPDRSLCADCRHEVEPVVTPRTLPDGSVVLTAIRYEGAVRHVLLAFKEEGRTDVAGSLAASLATAIARAAECEAEILAVPSRSATRRRRGFEPVRLLVRRTGMRANSSLTFRRAVTNQKTLGVSERERNMHGAMVATARLDGRRFILVDDVMTTGATLAEAQRAVVEAGGEVVARVALAFTPRISNQEIAPPSSSQDLPRNSG